MIGNATREKADGFPRLRSVILVAPPSEELRDEIHPRTDRDWRWGLPVH
jgi:hypothetical protein